MIIMPYENININISSLVKDKIKKNLQNIYFKL